MENTRATKQAADTAVLSNIVDQLEKLALEDQVETREAQMKVAKGKLVGAIAVKQREKKKAGASPALMIDDAVVQIPKGQAERIKQIMQQKAYQKLQGSSLRKLRYLVSSAHASAAVPVPSPEELTLAATAGGLSDELTLPLYDVEQIPNQTVWHGNTCEFIVDWKQHPSAFFSSRVSPEPVGEIKLKSYSDDCQLFSYTCDKNDKFPFTVKITASFNEKSASQSFVISPMQKLPSEQIVFGTDKYIKPGPMDSNRPEVIDQPSEHLYAPGLKFSFNYREPDQAKPLILRRVKILGETVIFDKNNDEFGLYATYHENQTIEQLELIAEQLIIRSPLHLPQTNVVINSKIIRIEGASARIITSPISLIEHPTPAEIIEHNDRGEILKMSAAGAGRDGLPAGNIGLNIEDVVIDSAGIKFDLTGGNGQPGGKGTAGIRGRGVVVDKYGSTNVYGWPAVPMAHNKVYRAPAGSMIVYAFAAERMVFGTIIPEPFAIRGVKKFPGNGCDALASGKPGEGGNGGTISSTIDIAPYVKNSGGNGGAVAMPAPADRVHKKGRWHYRGGRAGSPQKALWIRQDLFLSIHVGWAVAGKNESKPGVDALVEKCKKEQAGPGRLESKGNPFAWLHPILLRKLVNHSKDDYLGNRTEQAESKLKKLLESLDASKDSSAWRSLAETDRFEMEQMYDEMQIMLHRMKHNLDYFGHPAGWVPLLSFEVNETIFDNEIDRAAEVLYFAHFIKKKIATASLEMKDLKQVRAGLKKDIENAISDFNAGLDALFELKIRAKNLQIETRETQGRLEAKENELLIQVGKNLSGLFALKAAILGARLGLKIGGTLVSMLPVGQPATGLIGSGMTLISNFDPEKPWNTIIGGADITTKCLSSKYDEYAGKLNKQLNENNFLLSAPDKDLAKKKDFYKKAKNSTAALSSGLNDMQDFFAEFSLPEEEIDAELEKLRSQSDEFRGLVEQIKDLIAKKSDFAEELAAAMQQVASLYNFINYCVIAIDAMNADMSKVRAGVDERIASCLADMERRAYDRLLKYHYYLAKAYEYRLLRPYTEPLNFQQLIKRLEEIAEVDVWKEASPDIFKSLYKIVYKERLAEIAKEIFGEYSDQPRESSCTKIYNLLDDELDSLNNGTGITVNFAKHLPSEENLRITNIKILEYQGNAQNHGIMTEPVTGKYLANEHLDLFFEHSGTSKLMSGSNIYKFQHKALNAPNPFVWHARYFPKAAKLSHSEPSAAGASLLRSLLEGDALLDLMLYSRPAVWTDLKLSKGGSRKHGENIKITKLALELTYDYVRSHNSNVEMEVLVTTIRDIDKNKVKVSEASLKPYFVVSGKDKNDRQDARGSFLRIYDRSLDGGIKITVQPQYGEYVFNKWTDAFGQELPAADGNTISMGLRDDQIICAQYIPMEDAKTEAAKAVSAIPMAAVYTKNRQLKASEIASH